MTGDGERRPGGAGLTRILALAALASAVAPSAPGRAEWLLWPSPFEEREVLDQAQLQGADPVRVRAHRPVGQTFVVGWPTLHRMDFLAAKDRGAQPGTVRLWKWAGSREATIAGPVLFEDRLNQGGSTAWRIVTLFPRLSVGLGETYYVELSTPDPGGFLLRASRDGADRYPSGRLQVEHGEAGESWDLWFRTYADVGSSSGGRPEARSHSPRGLPWSEPEALGGTPSAEDYRAVIRDGADRVRAAHLESCGSDSHQHVFNEAFLYRASCREGACDERYARNAFRMFQLAHAWRFCSFAGPTQALSCSPRCEPDAGGSSDWMEKPGIAYLWLRDSPTLRDRDHEMIRELLADGARRFWPNRQAGTHSRAMQGAVSFLLACQLVPDAPESADWCRHAHEVWDGFWAQVDTEEDSGPYNWAIWWPQVLLFAEIGELDDAVWADPRFRQLVDRYAQLVAPLGVIPTWGDSTGWAADPSGLIWLLEKAAARYGKPKYRWLARQLFAYNRSHLRRGPRGAEPLYKGAPYLARAWLDADEDLEPTPPPPRREALAARHRAGSGASWEVEAGGRLGQTFRATATPLVRLDVQARGSVSLLPAQLSLWPWKGTLAATRAELPLFQTSVKPGGTDSFQTQSFFPFLDVEVGDEYYFELESAGAELALQGSPADTDQYPGGSLWRNGAPEPADLWFATYTLSPPGSSVTSRVRARALPREQWGEPPRQYELTGERVPDKLILRSGPDPGDLFAVFNLVSGYRHGQPERGALVALLDEGSLLVGDGPFPYWLHSRRPQDESLPLVQRYWGGGSSEPGDHVEVTRFADSRSTTVAWLEWNDPEGWGVRQERRVYFVRNRFLLLRDRFTFAETTGAAVGPIWHAGDVRPSHGPNWYDVYYREPLSNVWKVRNPEHYALLYFVPRSELEAGAHLEPSYLPPAECGVSSADEVEPECRAGPPYVVYQRWQGEAGPGTTRWLDTLIVPHGPETPPDALAENIRILHDDGIALALELRLGDETWLFVDNPGPDAIDAGDVSTDASYAIARVAPDTPAYALVEDASHLRWNELRLGWGVRTSAEPGGFAHRRATAAAP